MSILCYLRKPRLILRLILFSCVFFSDITNKITFAKECAIFIYDIPHVPLSVSVPVKCFEKPSPMGSTKIDNSYSQNPPPLGTYRGCFHKLTPSFVIHCLYWDVNLDFQDYEVVCNYEVVYNYEVDYNYEVFCNYEVVCNLSSLTNS